MLKENEKILVTGSRGQLGRELERLLPHAVLVDIDTLDITDAEAVKNFVRSQQVTHVINCAAYTAVDQAEEDSDLCRRINVDGVANLARWIPTVIHISTDYVFDGKGSRPYRADDTPQPASVYGKTKRAGELAVLETAQSAAVIRTSWLYSPWGKNFLNTMLRLGAEKESLSVVNDQWGSPTFAGDLAAAIVMMLPQIAEGSNEIYHYCNSGICSWADFAAEIMRQANLPCRIDCITTEQYPTRARRPAYSALDTAKICDTFGICIPTWQESLSQCLGRMKETKK